MAFVPHGPNQRAYESQSSVWSGPPKPGLKRAGRWITSQPPQVLRQTLSWYLPPKVAETAPLGLPVELLKFTQSSDVQLAHPGLSWYRSPQIPNPVAGTGMPIELLRFTTTTHLRSRNTEAGPVWWNVPRPAVKRAGRWITSQPRQPRTSSDSFVRPFSIVNIPAGILPEQLRKFVQGDPSQPRIRDVAWVRGIQIPNPPPAGTNEELRRFIISAPAQPKTGEASTVYHPQIPINADLYAVRRMFSSFVTYYYRFRAGTETLRRVEIPAAFPPLPIELQFFVTNADRQPVPRPEPSLWIPQLQASVVLPEELKRWIYGDDRMVLRDVQSSVGGIQIPNPAPTIPVELQRFVVGQEFIPLQRGMSLLLARYMPDTFPLPIELQQFLLTDPRQRPIIPHSSVTTRKIDELVAMPMELRHYVETAFQRYRSHYLVLRGTFQPIPVPDVVVRYKYFRGYTIIEKDTRLTP